MNQNRDVLVSSKTTISSRGCSSIHVARGHSSMLAIRTVAKQ